MRPEKVEETEMIYEIKSNIPDTWANKASRKMNSSKDEMNKIKTKVENNKNKNIKKSNEEEL